MEVMCTLPIVQHEAIIVQSIKKQPVVIISGKTGCGKSTQVPQFILKSNPDARIAVCEPRRLAATSLAMRVSEQQRCKVGSKIGYHIGMEIYSNDRTSIVYMTYGILIQQLLFCGSLTYTHIILDQVHERSLQMDFAFIALKRLLSSNKSPVKLIVMSATLNTDQFCNYFATHCETGCYFVPEIRYQQEETYQSNTRRRSNRHQQIKKNRVAVLNKKGAEYDPAHKIMLPDQNQYKITYLYLQEIKSTYQLSRYGDQVRATEELYSLVCKLIGQFEKEQSHETRDVLVLAPGMVEIKCLKRMLFEQGIGQQRIVEVHSVFSQGLYFKLFDKKVINKIILATNMAESSITLPNCKIVIDLCLTRKIFSNSVSGISRFETRLASKANLSQRAGRVGRVSNGTVYRLISRSDYESLAEYDIPEIKCVSLEIIILRAKQLDLINKKDIFTDPYAILLSGIEPPHIRDIDLAVEALLREQAVQRRTSFELVLTNIGEFMVKMPCDILISKMILLSLKLGIPGTIINICSIIIAQKGFFMHEEKRTNIEEFLHSLVGYDQGLHNDFLLRENLFSHWKALFYLPFKQKKLYKRVLKRTYPEEQEHQNAETLKRVFSRDDEDEEEINRLLQEFNTERASKKEYDWCGSRGVYPNVMREILKLSENIRARLQSIGHEFADVAENPLNQLVLFCLIYAFPGMESKVQWQKTEKRKKQVYYGSTTNYVSLPAIPETNEDAIAAYCHPEKDYSITKQKGGYQQIHGSQMVLSKFLLPWHYNKAKILSNVSPLYNFLTKEKVYYPEESQVFFKRRPVTVLNESINKVCIRGNSQGDCFLITNNIIESKEKKMIAACAMVDQAVFRLIQLMTQKDVKVVPHPSWQFYDKFVINGETHDSPSIIGALELKIIQKMRRLIKRDRTNKIVCASQAISKEDVSSLVSLLKCDCKRITREPWEYLFMSGCLPSSEARLTTYEIEDAPEVKTAQNYYSDYLSWKSKVYRETGLYYKPFAIREVTIICGFCWPTQIDQIDSFRNFDPVTQEFKLNEYSGSWKIADKELQCIRKHVIGVVLKQDIAKLNAHNVRLYTPFNRVEPFQEQYSQQMIDAISASQQDGIFRLEKEKNRVELFQCKVCFFIDEQLEPQRKLFRREELRDKFWRKVFEHMCSNEHLENLHVFQVGIEP